MPRGVSSVSREAEFLGAESERWVSALVVDPLRTFSAEEATRSLGPSKRDPDLTKVRVRYSPVKTVGGLCRSASSATQSLAKDELEDEDMRSGITSLAVDPSIGSACPVAFCGRGPLGFLTTLMPPEKLSTGALLALPICSAPWVRVGRGIVLRDSGVARAPLSSLDSGICACILAGARGMREDGRTLVSLAW